MMVFDIVMNLSVPCWTIHQRPIKINRDPPEGTKACSENVKPNTFLFYSQSSSICTRHGFTRFFFSIILFFCSSGSSRCQKISDATPQRALITDKITAVVFREQVPQRINYLAGQDNTHADPGRGIFGAVK